MLVRGISCNRTLRKRLQNTFLIVLEVPVSGCLCVCLYGMGAIYTCHVVNGYSVSVGKNLCGRGMGERRTEGEGEGEDDDI